MLSEAILSKLSCMAKLDECHLKFHYCIERKAGMSFVVFWLSILEHMHTLQVTPNLIERSIDIQL